MKYLVALFLTLAFLPLPATACGSDTDCVLGDRIYRVFTPKDPGADKPGALIFAHGYKGSAQGTMRNKSLKAFADKKGILLVAPDAIMDDWSIPNAPQQSTSTEVDEIAYFDALQTDLIANHNVDPDRIVVSGFSAGGMMVWNLACARPQDYAGFIPIAGTFWRAPPATCETPTANLIHIHGTSDKIVPLSGRPIAETHQGDVGQALEMYRTLGGYTPAQTDGLANLTCDAWRNANDTLLMQCLHDGGHSFKAEYLDEAWRHLMPID